MSYVDTADAIDRVLSLLPIRGRSREEGAVLAEIRAQLSAAGVPDDAFHDDGANARIPGGGAVGNLIVTLPGTQPGPRRLLMAHVDTVPICQGCRPVREGDYIVSSDKTTGLGGDDRAGASVVLTAAIEILKQKLPHPPLTLLFAVQEEIGLYGARFVDVAALGQPEACFNWDGGNPFSLCIGATGDIAMTIEIHGIASHAGVHPELGVNAGTVAALAISKLHHGGWLGLVRKDHLAGSSNIGIFRGGEATNVVLPQLSLRAEARSHSPEFRLEIVNQFRQAFLDAVNEVRTSEGLRGRVEFHSELKYEAFRLPENAVSLRMAEEALRAQNHEPARHVGNGGLDANWMAAHGLPTVTLGCGQEEIHTTGERLHIPSYLIACETAVRLGIMA